MFGKTEALAGRECPSNSNGTYECAVNKIVNLQSQNFYIFSKIYIS